MVSKRLSPLKSFSLKTNHSFKEICQEPFFSERTSLILFWCFKFFTLFNLQGAHRSQRQELYCTTLTRACQELFSRFSPHFRSASLFSVLSRGRFASQRNFYILPQRLPPCQVLFSRFFDFFLSAFREALDFVGFRGSCLMRT